MGKLAWRLRSRSDAPNILVFDGGFLTGVEVRRMIAAVLGLNITHQRHAAAPPNDLYLAVMGSNQTVLDDDVLYANTRLVASVRPARFSELPPLLGIQHSHHIPR